MSAQTPMNPDLIVRAIIGEASGEFGSQIDKKLIAMTAVAEAIRNRGTLIGVYGIKAKHVDKQPEWVWKLAKKALEASKTSNLVNGADHWENTKAFGKPYWADSMTLTTKIGNHNFYKARKD